MQNLGRFLLGIVQNEIKYDEKQRPQCYPGKFLEEAVCSQTPLLLASAAAPREENDG